MKGSLSWRNNNPGNIRFGTFTKRHGAIAENQGFAVFKNYEDGFNALLALLGSPSYCDLTLEQAIHRYAPSSENNTEIYIKFLETEVMINRNTILKEIDTQRLALAIQKFEGWIPRK